MLTTFTTTLSQMISLMLLLLIGFLLRRGNLLPKGAETVMSKLVTTVFLPAICAMAFLTECTVENLRTYGTYPLYGLGMTAIVIAIGYGLSPLFSRNDRYNRGVYNYALAYPNTGGIGNPLILAMFGMEGFFLFSLFLLPTLLISYTWGLTLLTPSEKTKSLKQILRSLVNPIFVAMFLGGVLGLTGISKVLPSLVSGTLEKLGGCYTVVALILSGYTIGGHDLGHLLSDAQTYLYTALRLLAIPLLFIGIGKLLHLPELLMTILCLATACPANSNVVVYPVSFGQDTKPGASMLLVSTVLSVITIPLLFAIL